MHLLDYVFIGDLVTGALLGAVGLVPGWVESRVCALISRATLGTADELPSGLVEPGSVRQLGRKWRVLRRLAAAAPKGVRRMAVSAMGLQVLSFVFLSLAFVCILFSLLTKTM